METLPLASMCLLFAPILFYAVMVGVLKSVRKLNFNRHALITAFAVIANVFTAFLSGVPLAGWFALGQLVATGVLFVLAIFFLGGKVSHETIFAFCAIMGLTPFVHFWGVPGLVAGLVVFSVMVVVFMKREKESIFKLVSTEVLNAAGYIHSGDVGAAYDAVPDKKDIADQLAGRKTFSMIPTVLAVGFVGLLWNLLGFPPSPLPPLF